MRDALGWRKKFGVLAPSTNTIVSPDYYRMTVPGVTAHFSRIFTPTADLSSSDAVERFLEGIRAEMRSAFERVLTCEPDYLIMGMSAETFWGGAEGNRQLVERMQDWAGGLGVATGAEAAKERSSTMTSPASASSRRTSPTAMRTSCGSSTTLALTFWPLRDSAARLPFR